MTKIPYGNPGDIPPVEEYCKADEFENYIREFGVVNACEWCSTSWPSGSNVKNQLKFAGACVVLQIGIQCNLNSDRRIK